MKSIKTANKDRYIQQGHILCALKQSRHCRPMLYKGSKVVARVTDETVVPTSYQLKRLIIVVNLENKLKLIKLT